MPENSIPEISMLERVGVAQIILYIYANQKQEITVNTLLDNIDACRETVLRAIEYVELNRLITIEKTKIFPFKHIIRLTDSGLRVGKLLASVVDVLRQDATRKEKSIHST
jgi:hypothetical protein